MKRTALAVALAAALFVISSLAAGCGSSSSGKKSNLAIAYTKVTGSGKLTLAPKQTTIIRISSQLGFVVGVENKGEGAEKNIVVNFVIGQFPPYGNIKKSVTIPEIRNGETVEAVIGQPFRIGTMIRTIPIRVSVAPVPGETNVADNVATYHVRFGFA